MAFLLIDSLREFLVWLDDFNFSFTVLIVSFCDSIFLDADFNWLVNLITFSSNALALDTDVLKVEITFLYFLISSSFVDSLV